MRAYCEPVSRAREDARRDTWRTLGGQTRPGEGPIPKVLDHVSPLPRMQTEKPLARWASPNLTMLGLEAILWRSRCRHGTRAVTMPSQDDKISWSCCPGCSGEIRIVGDWNSPTVACPKCGTAVALHDGPQVIYRPRGQSSTGESGPSGVNVQMRSGPPWMVAAGFCSVGLGLLAFLASAIISGQGNFAVWAFFRRL